MANAIEIKFSANLKKFVIVVDGVETKGFGLKENAVYQAKQDFPGAKVAVFKRNGDFQKYE